jgi:NitT/TauT family transport system permease protein
MKRGLGICIQWVVSLSLVLAAWQWWLAPNTSRVFLRGPEEVWNRLVLWTSDGELVAMVWPTMLETLLGLAFGTALGVLMACFVTLTPRFVGNVIEPAVVALYAAPKFAIVPLMYIWLGGGLLPRLIFVVIGVFAIIFVNTVSGIRAVDPDLVRAVQLEGATRRQVASKVLIRHAMGYVSTGLRFSASYALLIAIAAEMLFGTTEGIGGTLTSASGSLEATSVIAAIVVATVIAALLTGAANALGNRATWIERRAARIGASVEE